MKVRLQERVCQLLVAALWCPLPLQVSAQSLADAAKRAEEQRLQAPSGTQSFTDRDLIAGGGVDGGNHEALTLLLTVPLLQQYSNARTALLRAMVQSPDLARQVAGAMGRARQRGVDGLEHEYAMMPLAVGAINGQMDVHSYTVTDAAFMIAVGVLAGKLSAPQTAGTTIATNVAFLQRHQQEIAMWFKDATSLETQLARSLQNGGQLP